MIKVKVLLVAEVELEGNIYCLDEMVENRLDNLRESVLPSVNYGITLYRARLDSRDLSIRLLRDGLEIMKEVDA